MKLAFLLVPEEILISSTDPQTYKVRKDAGALLSWCARHGTVFLNTDLPTKTHSPEMILDLESVLWKCGYDGEALVWKERVEALSEGVRKSKFDSNFGQPVALESALTVDRVTGYSKLHEDGYSIIHLGRELSSIEKAQLKSYEGLFIPVATFPSTRTHTVRLSPSSRSEYEVVSSSEGWVYGPFPIDPVLKSQMNMSGVDLFLQRHSGRLIEAQLDTLPVASLMEQVPMAVADILMASRGASKVRKSASSDPTQDGVDFWADNYATKTPEDEGRS